MAGGMGGNDEDFKNYENPAPEEQKNQTEETQEGGENNSANGEPQGEGQEGQDEEGGEGQDGKKESNNPIIKKLRELREKFLKPKLQELRQKIQGRQIPIKNPIEKKHYDEAKGYEKLKPEVLAVDTATAAKWMEFSSKTEATGGTTAGSATPFSFYIFIIICVIVFLFVMVMGVSAASINGKEYVVNEKELLGVKGDKFYGVRTVYKDDELARTALLDDYATVIDKTIEEILTITSTAGKTITDAEGDKTITYEISVEIDLATPQGEADGEGNPTEFDYSNFDEASFSANYPEYYALMNEIAGIVYEKDAGTTAPATLLEKLDSILYFGLDAELKQTIQTKLEEKFLTLYNLSVYNETEDKEASVSDLPDEPSTRTEIETQIPSKVTEALSIYNNRAEKLFIKDYILNGSDVGVAGIQKRNYVAFIFMPKTGVTFTQLSFTIQHENIDSLNFKVYNNGSEITITKDEYNYGDMGQYGSSDIPSSYIYWAKDISVSANAYTDIDSSNLGAFSSGVSLAEILSDDSLTNETYLELNEDGAYTYKANGVYAEFESEEEFVAKEMETIYN